MSLVSLGAAVLTRLCLRPPPQHRLAQPTPGAFLVAQATRLWQLSLYFGPQADYSSLDRYFSCLPETRPCDPLLALRCSLHLFESAKVTTGTALCVRAPCCLRLVSTWEFKV